jgi:FKBP-type peptidyl-prolyl cis-trans isomerase FkpA
MKKIISAGIILIALATSCKKTATYECTSVTPTTVATASETAYLLNFLTANSIVAIEKNGMFYTISQGTGTSPNDCNNVTIDYVGNLINGTTIGSQFDASTAGQPSTFPLYNLIAGWRIALPLLKVGGTITLYIPPSLAYGSSASGTLPANSYLRFILTLRQVS